MTLANPRDFVDRAPERALRDRREESVRRRAAAWADASRFLTEDEELHECTHDEPCSRWYDPRPRGLESEPFPAHWYAGTGIGALYNLPGSEAYLWQLAGWNIGRNR